MLFVNYFPQLVAGPIVKHSDMIPQFNDPSLKKINWENMARGIVIFIVGLSKKVILADNLALIANYCFGNINLLDSLGAIVGMISYTFQIFFDFSGYCDMALGLGKMMNIKILVNFDSPYKSRSVKEFWRRWHITLNKFFTEYLYIPLGGNRKGKIHAFINVIIVFFLSGLWHGANWTFVIWGICHGICVAIQNLINIKEAKSKVILFCKWLVTFLFINLAWVLFASNDIKTALEYYKKIFSFSWNGSIVSVAYSTDSAILHIPLSLIKRISGNLLPATYIVYLCILLGTAAFLCTKESAYRWSEKTKLGTRCLIGLSIIFVMSIISLSNVSPFLYSNF